MLKENKIIILICFFFCLLWLKFDIEPIVSFVMFMITSFYIQNSIKSKIGNIEFIIDERKKIIKNLDFYKYNFYKENYINPMILEDLIGNISDLGHQISSINISDSNTSNRYFCDIKVEEREKYPVIIGCSYYSQGQFSEKNYFKYIYLGCSDSGMHILYTSQYSSEGTISLHKILFVTIHEEDAFENYNLKKRCIITLCGFITLDFKDYKDVEKINFENGNLTYLSKNKKIVKNIS